jgi:hypothetical protein
MHRAAAHSPITHEDIARRAFERYCARGAQDGDDLRDWFEAERELRAQSAVLSRPEPARIEHRRPRAVPAALAR